MFLIISALVFPKKIEMYALLNKKMALHCKETSTWPTGLKEANDQISILGYNNNNNNKHYAMSNHSTLNMIQTIQNTYLVLTTCINKLFVIGHPTTVVHFCSVL